ncbi:MAG: flagellar hook-length control protein FliK [Nitrospirae bacterium]|nr:flagellar hook-length control protein FliK [Nitrospirota bacterium]MBF0534929.1 flagellar hook-length control protein FliK [Nitrospirota bacterium]
MNSSSGKFGSVLNKVLDDKESTDLAGTVSASMLLMTLLGGNNAVTNLPDGASSDTGTVALQKAAPSIDMKTLGGKGVLNPDGAKDIKKSADEPKQDDKNTDVKNTDVKNTDVKSNKDTGSAEKILTDTKPDTEALLKELAAKNSNPNEEKVQATDAMNAAVKNLFKDNTDANALKENTDANLPKEKTDSNAPKQKFDPNMLKSQNLDTGDTLTKDVVQSQTDNNTGEKKQDKPADIKTGKEQVVEINDTQGTQQAIGAEKAQQNTMAAPHNVNNEIAVPKTPLQINDHTFSISKLSDSSIEVRLEPDGLGSVKIHLNMENGTIHADIRASDEASRAIIEKNLNDIVKALTQEGLTVGDFSVSLKDRGNQGEYKKQQGSGNKKGSDGELPEEEEITSVRRSGYLDNGKVSIFA